MYVLSLTLSKIFLASEHSFPWTCAFNVQLFIIGLLQVWLFMQSEEALRSFLSLHLKSLGNGTIAGISLVLGVLSALCVGGASSCGCYTLVGICTGR